MAIAFEIGVGYLLPELFTHTLVIFRTLAAAGAISPGPFQPFADGFYYLFVFVKSDHSIII